MKFTYKLLAILFILVQTAFAAIAQDAGFSATTSTEGCAPLVVSFYSNEQSNSYTHSWDLGNGANSTAKNPSRVYTAVGTYTIKHTISGSGGTATVTKTAYVTVHAKPTASFSASPLNGCPPLTVNFTNTSNPNTSGNATYSWVLGTGAAPAVSTSKNPSATYTTGPNNVTLTVTNSKGCVNTITKTAYIDVLPEPTVNFTANKTDFCGAPATVNFTPSITGSAPGPYTYAWTFGGAGTSTNTNPSQTFNGPAPAQYTVQLNVTSSNGCNGSVIKTNYIRLHDPVANFTGPSSACLYEVVNFTNTGSIGGGATYIWDFGDGSNTSNATNGSHIYTSAGVYTVKLTTTTGGCTDVVSKTITITPQANPQVIMSPDSLCPPPQNVTFSTVPAMSQYNWVIQHSSGTAYPTSTAPSQLYTTPGRYTTVVYAEDSYGCKDTADLTFDIFDLYIETEINNKTNKFPNYTDSGCVPFICKFEPDIYDQNHNTYFYGVKSAYWDFGDGNTSTAITPTHTYTDSGNFKIVVEIITNNNCTIYDTMFVKAGYLPHSNFKISPQVVCTKEQVLFTATSTGYDTLVYQWFFGDGNRATSVGDTLMTHDYACTDTFDVRLITSHKGCADDTTIEDAVEVLPPCAQWTAKANCSNRLEVQFTNQSIGDSTCFWDFGDGNTSTARDPKHTYSTSGTYSVMLAVYNSTTNCRDTATLPVFVGDNPVDMLSNKTTLCTGDSVYFHAYLTKDSLAAQNFDFYINGSLAYAGALSGFSHTFTQAGVYTVKVVSTDNEFCLDSITKTNWITVGRPKAGFVADNTHICEPNNVEFTDTSSAGPGTTIVSRFWSFGTSATDTLTTTNAIENKWYPQKGDFDVFLVVTDNLGCTDTVLKSPYIHVVKPSADFNVDQTVCVGEEVEFEDVSNNAIKYLWDFGDGNTDTTVGDVKHTYNTKGAFTATLIVTDTLGCKDTSAGVIINATKPTADFTMSDSMSVCPPLVVNFDGSMSQNVFTYTWDFDDGAGKGRKVKHTVVYNNIKNYKVTLLITDTAGCVDSITKDIQILGYAGAFDYTPKEGCAPLTVNFTSQVKGNVPTIVWDFGDGNTLKGSFSQPQISYTYPKPGKYLPKMVFNNGLGCNTSSDGLDTIIVDDVTADFETGPACQYSTVEFFNKSQTIDAPITVNTWTFHDGGFSALKDPKRNYGAPGKYDVKLYVKNNRGCEDSIETELTINEPIEVNAGGDTIICLADSAHLVPTGGVSYVWTPAATLSCADCNAPYAFPKVKTQYTVISTDVNGCHDTTQVEVDIKTHVESIAGKGGEICQGESITLSVEGGRAYQWTPEGAIDNPASDAPSVTPNENTNYRVVAFEGSCIPDTNFVEVIVHPKPTVEVRGGGEIVAGTSADLLASGKDIVRFLWTPSNTLSCSGCSDPVASPFKTTKYTVTVFSKYDCVDSADVVISVLCDESQLFIPNTFTPNGDGMNDIFMVRGQGISTLKSFRVYNRWGEVMFERTDASVNDKASGWDGTYNGAQLPPDVYVYTVEAYCENGDLLKLKGDITIIR